MGVLPRRGVDWKGWRLAEAAERNCWAFFDHTSPGYFGNPLAKESQRVLNPALSSERRPAAAIATSLSPQSHSKAMADSWRRRRSISLAGDFTSSRWSFDELLGGEIRPDEIYYFAIGQLADELFLRCDS